MNWPGGASISIYTPTSPLTFVQCTLLALVQFHNLQTNNSEILMMFTSGIRCLMQNWNNYSLDDKTLCLLLTNNSNAIYCIFSGFHNQCLVMILEGPFFLHTCFFVELPPECDSSDDSTQCTEGEICSQGVCEDGSLILLTSKNSLNNSLVLSCIIIVATFLVTLIYNWFLNWVSSKGIKPAGVGSRNLNVLFQTIIWNPFFVTLTSFSVSFQQSLVTLTVIALEHQWTSCVADYCQSDVCNSTGQCVHGQICSHDVNRRCVCEYGSKTDSLVG